jgi:hypothetical protein
MPYSMHKGEIPNQILKAEHNKAKEIIEEYFLYLMKG